MKRYFFYHSLLAACISVSCLNDSVPTIDKSNWVKYTLDSHWIFKAPKGVKIVYTRGVDSVPGSIFLKSDSLELEFDSGFTGAMNDTTCSLNSELLRTKALVSSGAYDFWNKPDKQHIIKVDTVNGMAAIFVTPAKAGVGVTHISISNCKSQYAIGITGHNIPITKQEMVLEIFKSIQYKFSK
jgi:hypothetical protein